MPAGGAPIARIAAPASRGGPAVLSPEDFWVSIICPSVHPARHRWPPLAHISHPQGLILGRGSGGCPRPSSRIFSPFLIRFPRFLGAVSGMKSSLRSSHFPPFPPTGSFCVGSIETPPAQPASAGLRGLWGGPKAPAPPPLRTPPRPLRSPSPFARACAWARRCHLGVRAGFGCGFGSPVPKIRLCVRGGCCGVGGLPLVHPGGFWSAEGVSELQPHAGVGHGGTRSSCWGHTWCCWGHARSHRGHAWSFWGHIQANWEHVQSRLGRAWSYQGHTQSLQGHT